MAESGGAAGLAASTRRKTPLCPLCAGLPIHFCDRGEFEILKCTGCAFKFASLPRSFDSAAIYSDEKYWLGGTDYGYDDYDQNWSRSERFYLSRLDVIERMQQRGSMLEIGCAAGYFLAAAKHRGWSIDGVEVSSLMRGRAQKRCERPILGSIDEALRLGSRYDCVVLFEVIEHVSDPVGLLRELKPLLAPGALIALSTPNCEGVQVATNPYHPEFFIPPAHLVYFGPGTLKRCVELAGYRAVALTGLFNSEEIPLPRWLSMPLEAIRKGKRTRPHGILGRLIRKYQRGRADALYWTDTLELYARAD